MIGIIQGRLSESINGHIQEFPYKTWEDEFNVLNKLGLTHIEWIITNSSFKTSCFPFNSSTIL